jgi:hypothetical protein
VLALDGAHGTRVGDGGLDLPAMAHDARITQQALHVALRHALDPARIEAGESPPVSRALAEDGRPAEPRLGAFQDEQLEEPAVVVQGHAPLAVVIRHLCRPLRPVAAPSHHRPPSRGYH